MSEGSDTPASALKVAKWLVDKGRPDDAVTLLAAWAATGGNTPTAQGLLAEALRIDPSSPLAQMAFERMENIPGDHSRLQAAIDQWTADEIARLEKEINRPTFRRAQMGFNNNVKYNAAVYHVQTEDSGLDAPHIITHLFADGGRVIKSHKRSYASEVNRPEVGKWVRELMKNQHLEMIMLLRESRFDEIIAGRAIGGITELTEPPNVDIAKLKRDKTEAAEQRARQAAAAAHADAAAHQQQVPVYFRLHVLRSLSGGPPMYEPPGDQVMLGREGAVDLPGEEFCGMREALLHVRDGRLFLQGIEGGNGVFLRIRTPIELEMGDEFVVGDQLLRVKQNPAVDDGPDPDPTYFYSSPKWPSSFRVAQILSGGAEAACVVARGNTLQVGSAIGDLVFPDDPLVAEQHCLVEEQAGSVVLTDLGSRTGVFVRINGEQELVHGDELMVGRTRLVVETLGAAA